MTSSRVVFSGLILLIVGFASPAFAAKPDCTLDPSHSSCKDGDSDPPADPIFDGDTRANWSLDNTKSVWEGAQRSCWLEGAATNGLNGHYVCLLEYPSVNFKLDPGQEIDKKGNAVSPSDALCSSMNEVSLTSTHYPYNWNGDCTSATGCRVRVRNWFAPGSNPDRPEPNRTGTIVLDGFASISATSNANPYADRFEAGANSAIQMDELIVTFKGNGTNKNEAVCRWSQADGNLTLGEVEFDSVPE